MLKRGEVDVAYLLDAPQAAGGQARSQPQAGLLRRHRHRTTSTSSTSGTRSRRGPTGACGWPPTTPSTARRSARPRRSAPRGRPAASSRARSSSRCRSSRIPTIRRKAKQLLAEAGYPNGFDAGELLSAARPTSRSGEAIVGYLGAVGIQHAAAARWSAPPSTRRWPSKKLKGVCVCINALYGNAASRMSEIVPSDGAFAYGGYPDIDALYKQQARETDRKKREAMLHQIQQLAPRARPLRRRSSSTSGRAASGPRVAEPGADADRSLPVVGAARRGAAQEELRPEPARAGHAAPAATGRRRPNDATSHFGSAFPRPSSGSRSSRAGAPTSAPSVSSPAPPPTRPSTPRSSAPMSTRPRV